MKRLCCFALLLAGAAQAGELLPTHGGEDEEDAEKVQDCLDEYARAAVEALPASVKVEPIIESMAISSFTKRMLLGPFAKDSHIKLRIRIIDGERVTETLIEDEGGNWVGTVKWGQDGNMLEEAAMQAAEFIHSYRNANSPPQTDEAKTSGHSPSELDAPSAADSQGS